MGGREEQDGVTSENPNLRNTKSAYESPQEPPGNFSHTTSVDPCPLSILPANAKAATPSPTAIKLLAYGGKKDDHIES